MVVVGEAGEAGHAAGVIVLEPFEEFAQFFPAFLFLLQPLSLLLGRHSAESRTISVAEEDVSFSNCCQTLPEREHLFCLKPVRVFIFKEVAEKTKGSCHIWQVWS